MANWVREILEQEPAASGLPVAERSRYGLHLRRAGRQRLALLSGAPVHYYHSASRQWLPIDTTLQLQSDGGYSAPGLPFSLAADGGVQLAADGYRHKTWRVGVLAGGRFSELQRLPAAKLDGDRLVRQAGVFRHEAILLPNGLREELTILEPPSLPGRSSDLLVLESLLPAAAFPEGWVDAHQRGRLSFPEGWAVDAQGQRVPLMRWSSMKGKVQHLYSGVPLDWLDQAAYPVVLDPDIDLSSDTADGQIEGLSVGAAAAHNATATNMTVGGYTYGGYLHLWRGYFKFATSSLGPGATVEQVNIKLYPEILQKYVSWTSYVRHYDWSANDPMQVATREAAWDGLYAAANVAVMATSGNPAGTHVVSHDLPTGWVNILGNTYYGLWCNMEGYSFPNSQGSTHYYSTAENATAIQRPMLMLEYLGGYPRSGPIALRAVLPAPRVSLVDTRQKLRARARRTALHANPLHKE